MKNIFIVSILVFIISVFTAETFAQKVIPETKKEIVFTSIPDALEQKNKVYNLNIREQNFYSIPAEICVFPNLLNLNASKNKIMEIASEIKSMKKLKEINFHENQLKYLPEHFLN